MHSHIYMMGNYTKMIKLKKKNNMHEIGEKGGRVWLATRVATFLKDGIIWRVNGSHWTIKFGTDQLSNFFMATKITKLKKRVNEVILSNFTDKTIDCQWQFYQKDC